MIGLSTYAYFWRWSARMADPMSLIDMLTDARELGAEVFQICDWRPLATAPGVDLDAVRGHAGSLGLTLEVGTRGTSPEVLERHAGIAKALDATLVRSMWTAGDDRPSPSEAEARIREVLPMYRDLGLRLALETYEQVSTRDLVTLVETIGEPNLGICLDPANTVANLESPEEVTRLCAPYVVNWHVKDFHFIRQDGWVGFTLTGARMGTGRLDYDAMLDVIQPHARSISQIVEHWLPWAGDAEVTAEIEADWTAATLDRIRAGVRSG